MRKIDVRERLCQSPVSLKLRRAKMKWLGHFERMGNRRQVRRIMNREMEGRRPIGRHRTTWEDVIRRDLESSCPKRGASRIGGPEP